MNDQTTDTKSDALTLHELWRRVTDHPDFRFGVCFGRNDFDDNEGDDSVPTGFNCANASQDLVIVGNHWIGEALNRVGRNVDDEDDDEDDGECDGDEDENQGA